MGMWGSPKEHPPIPGDPGLEGVQHPCSNPSPPPPRRGCGGLEPARLPAERYRSLLLLLLLLFFHLKKEEPKVKKNKIVFSSVLESTWINNSSRNWAAETINFLWTQPKKDAGRRWLPSPGGGSWGAAVGAGPGPALLSKCVNSKHMRQIRHRLRPEHGSLLCTGISGREKRGPGAAERC